MSSEIEELKAVIRAHERFMRENRIRKTSFMNGGLTPDEYQANKELFSLKTELMRKEQNAVR